MSLFGLEAENVIVSCGFVSAVDFTEDWRVCLLFKIFPIWVSNFMEETSHNNLKLGTNSVLTCFVWISVRDQLIGVLCKLWLPVVSFSIESQGLSRNCVSFAF